MANNMTKARATLFFIFFLFSVFLFRLLLHTPPSVLSFNFPHPTAHPYSLTKIKYVFVFFISFGALYFMLLFHLTLIVRKKIDTFVYNVYTHNK